MSKLNRYPIKQRFADLRAAVAISELPSPGVEYETLQGDVLARLDTLTAEEVVEVIVVIRKSGLSFPSRLPPASTA